MGWIVLVSLVAFIRSFVATLEVLYIAYLRPTQAMLFGAVNSAGCFLLTFAVVEATQKLTLIIPYVIGEVSATVVAILIFKWREQRRGNGDKTGSALQGSKEPADCGRPGI